MFDHVHILFTAVHDYRMFHVRAGTVSLPRHSKSMHIAWKKLGHFKSTSLTTIDLKCDAHLKLQVISWSDAMAAYQVHF